MGITAAEILLEKFCRERGIECRRLNEGPTRMPDYELRLGALVIAAEVKQLEPNAEDKVILEQLRRREVVTRWENMERPRQSILDATRQLRAYARGVMPAVCVLYDTFHGLFGYLDLDNISQCLYGAVCYHCVVPDPVEDSRRSGALLTGVSLGGRRVATEKHNTTLSAVGVLRLNRMDDTLSMAVFHNRYAAIPIDPAAFRLPEVTHFVFRAENENSLPDWVAV
jgi:hypothetical protein